MGAQQADMNFVEVTAADLPLYCPPRGKNLWNSHPKVIIPVTQLGEARCPYCSTLYKFKGALPHGHH